MAGRGGAAPLVLHANGSRGPAADADAAGAAAAGDEAGGVGAVAGGLRDGVDDHGPGERARRPGGLAGGLGPGARPGPAAVLAEGVRPAVARGTLVVAVRRAPRVGAPRCTERHSSGQHAVLPRRGPGGLAAAR